MAPVILIKAQPAGSAGGKKPVNPAAAKPDKKPRQQHKLEDVLCAARKMMRLYDIEGYEKAVAFLRHALDQSPAYAPAHAALAEAFSLWGFRLELNGGSAESYYKLAVEHAAKAKQLAPERADSHRAVAVAHRRGAAADPKMRKEAILCALDLEPESADNWYEYWRAFGYSPADAAVKRALELDPSCPGIYIDLGVVLCEGGRLKEAERYLRHALKLVPRNSLVLYNLAMVLDRQGRRDEALKISHLAVQEHPKDPLVLEGHKRLVGGNDEPF
ncbi:MAG: tetratricopeptide repeat protein [Elusimicrobiota bacterium]